jgi:hypothetical protein
LELRKGGKFPLRILLGCGFHMRMRSLRAILFISLVILFVVKTSSAQTNAAKSAEQILELVKKVEVGTADEYREIPAIWRVAIAAGKRNDAIELKEILSIGLPKPDEPLRDWQAVVIGGGIINGLSLEGIWPRERIEKILRGDSELETRWLRSIKLASLMADDEKVRHGTRYDALRMLGVASWKDYGAQFNKYLGKGVNGELQQGAVSGLSDVDSNEAAKALIENFENFTEGNQRFALDALLRNDSRIDQLLNAVAGGKIKFAALGAERVKKLKSSSDHKIRERVEKLEKSSRPN